MIEYLRDKYKIEVFFNQSVSNQEAVGLVHKIRKIKGVRTASLIEKEDALRIFKDQFNEDILKIISAFVADSPSAVILAELDNNL